MPPPQMVGGNQQDEYAKLVPWLTKVLHDSGTYGLMERFGIDPLPFVLTLTKSESDFKQRVVSPMNAFGFMQLLVPTARRVCSAEKTSVESMLERRISCGSITGQTLKDDWKLNIVLGTLYLKKHVEEFGSRVAGLKRSLDEKGKVLINLISGAYNAGEGALRKYLARMDRSGRSLDDIDPRQSVIPYNETENYVRKIQRWYGTFRTWIDARTDAIAAGQPGPVVGPRV